MSGFTGPYKGPLNGPSNGIPASAYSNGRWLSDNESGYSYPYQEQQFRPSEVSNGVKDNGRHNKNGKNVAIHRPRLNRKSSPEEKKSNLTTKFDPMKDRHMWAMWRTAVNGRIVDQVRRNEQFKHDAAASEDLSVAVGSDTRSTIYGKDLTTVPPLSRFIRLNQKSKNIAQELMNEGNGELETTQFIYYGLPRVTANTYINRNNNNNHMDSGYNVNNYHYTNGSSNGYGDSGPEFNPYAGRRS